MAADACGNAHCATSVWIGVLQAPTLQSLVYTAHLAACAVCRWHLVSCMGAPPPTLAHAPAMCATWHAHVHYDRSRHVLHVVVCWLSMVKWWNVFGTFVLCEIHAGLMLQGILANSWNQVVHMVGCSVCIVLTMLPHIHNKTKACL